MSNIHQIHNILSKRRFDVSTEEILQKQIEEVFASTGIDFQREVRLSGGERIDFLAGGLGIEVKIKGSPNAIYRQCERYCALGQINELLLVTNRAMGMPNEINGKPCYVLNLGRGWL